MRRSCSPGLVATAEIIAHAVVGLDPATLAPATVLNGQRFAQAGISGVEEDFFDWVAEVPGGESFVRTLARRLMRFSWGEVEHDVMKVLYNALRSYSVGLLYFLEAEPSSDAWRPSSDGTCAGSSTTLPRYRRQGSLRYVCLTPGTWG